MSTRKIGEDSFPCRDPEHDPASMIVRSPGTYEHECPKCHTKQYFKVPGVYL